MPRKSFLLSLAITLIFQSNQLLVIMKNDSINFDKNVNKYKARKLI